MRNRNKTKNDRQVENEVRFVTVNENELKKNPLLGFSVLKEYTKGLINDYGLLTDEICKMILDADRCSSTIEDCRKTILPLFKYQKWFMVELVCHLQKYLLMSMLLILFVFIMLCF